MRRSRKRLLIAVSTLLGAGGKGGGIPLKDFEDFETDDDITAWERYSYINGNNAWTRVTDEKICGLSSAYMKAGVFAGGIQRYERHRRVLSLFGKEVRLEFWMKWSCGHEGGGWGRYQIKFGIGAPPVSDLSRLIVNFYTNAVTASDGWRKYRMRYYTDNNGKKSVLTEKLNDSGVWETIEDFHDTVSGDWSDCDTLWLMANAVNMGFIDLKIDGISVYGTDP